MINIKWGNFHWTMLKLKCKFFYFFICMYHKYPWTIFETLVPLDILGTSNILHITHAFVILKWAVWLSRLHRLTLGSIATPYESIKLGHLGSGNAFLPIRCRAISETDVENLAIGSLRGNSLRLEQNAKIFFLQSIGKYHLQNIFFWTWCVYVATDIECNLCQINYT